MAILPQKCQKTSYPIKDPLDRVTSMTSPAGTTNYHYDTTTGRLDKITSPEGKEFNYSYNHGQLSTLDYPNGITAHYAFDDNGNLTDLHYQKSGSTVKRYQYRYDKNGMRDTMIDNDGVHSYAYDQLYLNSGSDLLNSLNYLSNPFKITPFFLLNVPFSKSFWCC